MKNLAIAILVFGTFICAAYSFKCYKCPKDDDGGDEEYTTKQCEDEQTKIDCPTNYTCFKMHGTTTKDDGAEREARGCMTKDICENFEKICKEGTDEQKKAMNVKECEAACCVSDGDTPCNSGFTVSINMVMIMLAVLCSLKIF